MAVAVNAALVSFGLSEPAFEVEVVLGQVPILPVGERKARYLTARLLTRRVAGRPPGSRLDCL